MRTLIKTVVITVIVAGTMVIGTGMAYWWSNVPPKRPKGVSSDAVFLWAGHLGLPAPKHGTWLECWADAGDGSNKCRLTEMDGTPGYEGIFLANTGRTPVPLADLKILSEQTSQSVDLWVRIDQHFVPLVFLQDGTVLIPKDGYQEGIAKLEHLRKVQGKEQ